MPEPVTVETFSPHVGEPFRVRLGDAESLELRLAEAKVIGSPSAKRWAEGGRRAPFSLLFRGRSDAVLPQQTYRVEHDGIGGLDIFLVPLGPDAEGMRYEAVFT